MSNPVTGDAVVLGLQPAKLLSRALAIAIDLAVLLAGYYLVTLVLLSAVQDLGFAASAATATGLLALILVGVPVAVETLSRGKSLGKLIFGLRVVRGDGGPVRFRHALVRGLVGVVEILLTTGSVACIASLVSERGRRIGDVFAGTLVVRERIPAPRAWPLPPPPPELAGQFAELDLSRVPDGLWLTVRQLLARLPKMDARVGRSMAERLAGDLVRLTGRPAPPGADPARYLRGVAWERQRRDAWRLQVEEQQVRQALLLGEGFRPGRPPERTAPPSPPPAVPSAGPPGEPSGAGQHTGGAGAGGRGGSGGFVPPA
ncbi:RDD family protein [Streptomyces sp. YIM 98790]|uniref:RDD family protein n=1 Tax=Streptomyces sp. YIM 98790 TaxID=2689077 RepID=UPI001A9F788C|nr:RDD family protein [Streptomyces sp. YIM 98790]